MKCNLKIYLADDDQDDVWIFQEAFKKYYPNIQIEVYEDGEKLLDAIHVDETPPTFIFLDINMPVMDGFDALTKLKASPPISSIPTFMFSSSEYGNHIQRSYQLGATSYFKKPTNYSEYLKMVEIFKAYWEFNIVAPSLK
ncbi:response regulator [Larkinella sp. GY13]|uniref:response regulator n=1 Tax=Larkinella sp. GY13 TaxID=3453720 RepID=UPI003EF04363